jgi:iron complex transport system substrate-binding protein
MAISMADRSPSIAASWHLLAAQCRRVCTEDNRGTAATGARVRSRTWLVLALSIAVPYESATAASRNFVDAAGREVAVPSPVQRVYAAGAPAAVLLYTLAPDRMIGWNRPLTEAEKSFMAPGYRDLPELGQLTGRGNTANVETVLKARPDVIVDYGSTAPTFVSLADRVADQTRIPYVLIDGAFEGIPQAYRLLGRLLGTETRADRLARYAEQTLAEVGDVLARVATAHRPRVYYARRPDGLETGRRGSINVELLERVGAINVAGEESPRGGLTKVSLEQILKWNPDVILTLEPAFYASVFDDPLWSALPAVRARRVYLAPSLPFGWFDRPPSVNRLMGVKWLLAVLYPDAAGFDLRAQTREFYRLFYHLDLTDGQLDRLLAGAIPSRR